MDFDDLSELAGNVSDLLALVVDSGLYQTAARAQWSYYTALKSQGFGEDLAVKLVLASNPFEHIKANA